MHAISETKATLIVRGDVDEGGECFPLVTVVEARTADESGQRVTAA